MENLSSSTGPEAKCNDISLPISSGGGYDTCASVGRIFWLWMTVSDTGW